MLVTGFGSISDAAFGAAMVGYYARSNVLGVRVATLSSPGIAATFGYWDGGDGYWYIGVYRGSHYSPLSVMLLTDAGEDNYAVELGDFYQSATQPTGWTKVLSSPYDSGVYASSITTLALMKSQMKTWIDEMPVTSSRYVCMAVSAFTPFTTGGTISVQINKSNVANYGTALITKYQNAAGAEVYSMSYYNGTWTDPKKLAFA